METYRIIVASVILGLWVTLQLASVVSHTGTPPPFVDVATGAVVSWLFGASVLMRKRDDDAG